MNKNWFLLIIGIILIILLPGCKKTMKITDFDGLRDLPKNPSKIIFETNSMNFDENEGIYREPTEYEVPNEKISQIVEKLFTISYQLLADNIDIDLSPIIRFMTFHNERGDIWKVELGLKRQNERWYYPVDDKELIDLLYESTADQLGMFYTLDNNNFLKVYDLVQMPTIIIMLKRSNLNNLI